MSGSDRGRSTSRRAVAGVLLSVVATTAVGVVAQDPARTPARPNIVLIFPDNLGVGEVGAYGGARAVPTPNIDRLADEGIRLTNFNVEYSCVVSRIAMLTGPRRQGLLSVGDQRDGRHRRRL